MMRRHGSHRGSSVRRPTQWVGGNAYNTVNQYTALAATTTTSELVGATSVAGEFDPPLIQRFTVERIRGQLILYLTGLTSALAPALVIWAAGIQLVSTTAAAAGAPLQPRPDLQPDSGGPWLWLEHNVFALEASASGAVTAPGPVFKTHFEVDIKAKRKVREDQILCLFETVQVSPGGTALTFNSAKFLRTLISRVA